MNLRLSKGNERQLDLYNVNHSPPVAGDPMKASLFERTYGTLKNSSFIVSCGSL
jgi:hypothetical protein